MQAGHFIPGRHNSIVYDERNINGQCYRCNCMLKGNMVKYYKFMLAKYGQDVIDELEELDKQNRQISIEEYEQLIILYKQKLCSL